MIPVSDDNSSEKSFPIVTYALIAINFLFFFLELAGGDAFVMKWAFVASRFVANPVAEFPTLFTSMFMHAGWAHILGNMLYLYIFGDNVEDYFGKIKYLILYFLSGLAATFAQFMFTTASDVPNLGASGAIAGVLGAYLYLFPQGKVNVMLGYNMSQMPALIVIGFWFVIQFISSFSTMTGSTADAGGGVAYFAHVGGFIAGLLLALLFKFTSRFQKT